MGITCDRGRWYFVKRVPRRFAGLILGRDGRPVSQVRVALRTDSRAEARAKAPAVEAEILAYWEAVAAGNTADARARYTAARDLAQARGFAYVPADRLAEGDLSDLVARVLSLARPTGPAPDVEAAAVLGLVPPALPDLREVLAEFFRLTSSRVANKTPAQLKRWRARRERAVEHFCEATQDPRPDGTYPAPPVDRIDRAEALVFRAWCADRVAAGQAVDTQNKDIGALSDILSTWSELTGAGLENPFKGLRLEGRDLGGRATYDRAFLRDRLLPGLDGLNAEAAAVVRVLVNTGIRPSELLNAPRDALRLDHAVPHLDIAQARGRELKQAHTARAIPLVGVSLEAAQALAAAPRWLPRYGGKGDHFSAAANKYLAARDLRPTPAHTVYSIRHSVEDALLNAGVDDRVRADILGHRYTRPRYGTGGALPARRAALELIAL